MNKNSGSNAIERLLARIIALPICLLLSAWCMTLNRQVQDLSKLDQMTKDGHRVLAMFWHGEYLPLFALAKGRNVVVVTTNSFRGNVIANICHWFGYQPVRLPVRGRGMHVLAEHFNQNYGLYAVALDGPLGPYHRIKHGALQLAIEQGVQLVPIGIQSKRKIVLSSRWDKQEIPLPFSRVSITVGDMIDGRDTAAGPDHAMLDQTIAIAMEEQSRLAKDLL